MQIYCQIRNVQHVRDVVFSIDLRSNSLTCIVGKNGVGKTTLIKSIKNLASADTFTKTSSDQIFQPASSILYKVDDQEYNFTYDESIDSLNCRSVIPADLKSLLDVELPMPHGQRFNFFQNISQADSDIRKSIVLEDYKCPDELIGFLSEVYDTVKFKNLVEINIKNIVYYCIVLADSRYIREDYLSSGEYFLISLYRKIRNQCKLIVIDEIDISLDAAAQVRLIKNLRQFCLKYEVNIVFTTHSLAMMRTLEDHELFYMAEKNGVTEIIPVSYNYVKTILFGFTGWDKYILTEDIELKEFIEFVINRYCPETFYSYKIICVGGGGQVVGLMKRNEEERFLSCPENVISILDGDQKNKNFVRRSSMAHCIPFTNIESMLFTEYENPNFLPRLPAHVKHVNPKSLFSEMTRRHRVMSVHELHTYLCDKYDAEVRTFSEVIKSFLSPA